MRLLAGVVVVTFALFLLGLAWTIYVRPPLAERFLNAFARSASAHYAEQAVRLVVGGSFVRYASEMWLRDLFRLFGWVVVVTTVGLLCVPWRWHRRFAQRVVPPAVRHLKLVGAGAALLGAAVLYSLAVGGTR